VNIVGISNQPDGRWMKQIARNLSDGYDGFLNATRYLIHDRDPLFTSAFSEILVSSGVKTVKLPARSPDLNAYAERFVRSIKEECLSQIIPLGERHLRRAVAEYTEHYHLERNHQGLGNELIERPTEEADGGVECRERLGGVLKYYYRRAA
jgi:putative transposase